MKKTTIMIGAAILAFVGGAIARPALENVYEKIKGKVQKTCDKQPAATDNSSDEKK